MDWPLFDGVDEAELRELLVHARRRRFARGDSVFHEGDLGDSLHLLDRGHAAIRVTTPAGDVATLRILRAGDHFGDLAVLSTGRRSATVTALERLETLELQGSVLKEFQEGHRSIERAISRALASHVRSMSSALVEAMYLPVPRRLARRLRDLGAIYESDDIPLTQEDLAGITGTTRQTVNQVLTELRERGVIELRRGHIIVLDRQGLDRASH